MGLRDAFDVLSDVLGGYESRGVTVRSVETTTDSCGDGALRAVLEIPVSVCDGAESQEGVSLSPSGASLTDRGDLTVTFDASEVVPAPSTPAATAVDRAVRVDEGQLLATVAFTLDPGNGSEEGDRPTADGGRPLHEGGSPEAGSRGETDPLAAARSPDVPPYDDTEYLQALYDACDTFAEMSDRIPMDVAAETVRRYMIDAGVHDPSSYDTAEGDGDGRDPADGSDREGETGNGSDRDTLEGFEVGSDREVNGPTAEADFKSDAETADEQLIADGIGLPDGVYLQDVVDAVTDATTVYEVQRSLGLGHRRTHDLLRRLNVLDLLLHRVDRPHEAATERDVLRRIRQCTPADRTVEA